MVVGPGHQVHLCEAKKHKIETFCGSKFKFSGLRRICISKNLGFTKFNVYEVEDLGAQEQFIPNNYGVKERLSPRQVAALHFCGPPLC